MPTYQYACTECGHQLEAVQSFSDASLVECPECAGRLRKLFSAVGIVFKGSGFYRTDSRSAATADVGAAPKSDSSSTPAKDSTSTSTADSTPAKPSTTTTSSTPTKSATPTPSAK